MVQNNEMKHLVDIELKNKVMRIIKIVMLPLI